MTSCHALYEGVDGQPWLIVAPLGSGPRSEAVALPASGAADVARVRVTVRQPEGRVLADPAREDDLNETTLAITVDGEQQKLTVIPVEATGHVAFTLSAGGRGVVGIDEGDTDVQGILGVDDLALVAIVAIIAIAGMVAVSEGADVVVKAGDVEVTAEGGGDGERREGGS